MPLLQVVLILIAVGVLLWLAQKYIPMDADVKNILKVVVLIVVIVWLLQIFGVWGYLSNIRVGR